MSKSVLRSDAFLAVREFGCRLPNVEAATKYDGSPVLKANGAFMAGLATHQSAEPDTLVLRVDLEERPGLLEDAPAVYYITEYYRRFPVVLVRLAAINRDVLRELLAGAWRITTVKAQSGLPAS
jgi:hypothetical protein